MRVVPCVGDGMIQDRRDGLETETANSRPDGMEVVREIQVSRGDSGDDSPRRAGIPSGVYENLGTLELHLVGFPPQLRAVINPTRFLQLMRSQQDVGPEHFEA